MIFLSELLKQTLDINIGSTFEKIQNKVTDTVGHYWISPYKHWGKCTRKVNGHGFRVPWKNWGTYLWLFICCKTKLKKKIFFNLFVFCKIYIICRKNVFIWKKSFILKIFLLKKTFFTEKNINENVKNISHFRNIFLHRKCLCYK